MNKEMVFFFALRKNSTDFFCKNYLYEGKGKACAGQIKAKASPNNFSKVPNDLESDENFGIALPIGSDHS